MFFSASACLNPPDYSDIAGKYYYYFFDEKQDGNFYELKADGTWTGSGGEKGTFKKSGANITFYLNKIHAFNGSSKDGRLTLMRGGEGLVFLTDAAAAAIRPKTYADAAGKYYLYLQNLKVDNIWFVLNADGTFSSFEQNGDTASTATGVFKTDEINNVTFYISVELNPREPFMSGSVEKGVLTVKKASSAEQLVFKKDGAKGTVDFNLYAGVYYEYTSGIKQSYPKITLGTDGKYTVFYDHTDNTGGDYVVISGEITAYWGGLLVMPEFTGQIYQEVMTLSIDGRIGVEFRKDE